MSEYMDDAAREELSKVDRKYIAEAMELIDPNGLINVTLNYHSEKVRGAKGIDLDTLKDTSGDWLNLNPAYCEAMDEMGTAFVRAISAVVALKAAERKASEIHGKVRRDISAIVDARLQLEALDTLSIEDFLPPAAE